MIFQISLFITFITFALGGDDLGSTRPIVRKFQETLDLWTGLKDSWTLPGFHNPFTNTPPTNGWISYLEQQGREAITRS